MTDDRVLFQCGTNEKFFFRTKGCLGPIKAITLTHDDNGISSDWFVKRAKVLDPTTGQYWNFRIGKWVSSYSIKGRLSRYLTVTWPRKKTACGTFWKTYWEAIKDSHAVISIFQSEPESHFTKAQRLTCTFASFVMAMLVNIMFFDVVAEPEQPGYEEQLTDFYGFEINRMSVMVSLESAAVSFIYELIIVQLFGRIKTEDKEVKSELKKCTEPHWEADTKSLTSITSSVSDYSNGGDSNSKLVWPSTFQDDSTATKMIPHTDNFDREEVCNKDTPYLVTDEVYNLPLEPYLMESSAKAKVLHTEKISRRRFTFPAWFIYIVWSVTVAICFGCTYFIMLYGLTYGYEKSYTWAESNIIAFVVSSLLDAGQIMLVHLCMSIFEFVTGKPSEEKDEGKNEESDDDDDDRKKEKGEFKKKHD